MTPARHIASLYLQLPYHEQVKIAAKFGFNLLKASQVSHAGTHERDKEFFTFIKENNKLEIFYNELTNYYHVSSKYGEWCINGKKSYQKEMPFDNQFTRKEAKFEDEQVIGNIFENPKLIKK